MTRTRFAFLSLLLVLGSALSFWVPGLRATGGPFPVPLDDVFIHFNYARSIAEGHPFEWISGQGYSSGESSPLYPFLLAIGYLVGFRGASLAVFAAIVAVAGLVSFFFSLRRLLGAAPALVTGALLLSVGIVAFTLFSGMEVAAFLAALGYFVVAARDAARAEAWRRDRATWRAGLLGMVLVMLRPEAVFVVGPVATYVARHARSRSGVAAFLRVAAPAALFTIALAITHRAMTGDAQAAGAILKLLSEQPYLRPFDKTREFVLNLLAAKWAFFDRETSALRELRWLPVVLTLVPLAFRRTRALGGTLIASAILWTLLVSTNNAARFQNFRYYVPAMALLTMAIGLGLAELLKRRRSVVVRAAGLLAVLACGASAIGRYPHQTTFFAGASGNIRDQQVRMGEYLRAHSGPDDVVLIGDAGAIPYVSQRHALDALGLGAYGHLPFTRAATFGEGAVLELIERLPPRERPTYLAVFPEWFPTITKNFGRETFRITLGHNVISGGPAKVLYRAEWDGLGERRPPANVLGSREVVDDVDVGDVVSERAHRYRSPAPEGGWMDVAILEEDGRRLFDAGRIIPSATFETIAAHARTAAVVVRTDRVEAPVIASCDGSETTLRPVPAPNSTWIYLEGAMACPENAPITLRVGGGAYRDFHVWLLGVTGS